MKRLKLTDICYRWLEFLFPISILVWKFILYFKYLPIIDRPLQGVFTIGVSSWSTFKKISKFNNRSMRESTLIIENRTLSMKGYVGSSIWRIHWMHTYQRGFIAALTERSTGKNCYWREFNNRANGCLEYTPNPRQHRTHALKDIKL